MRAGQADNGAVVFADACAQSHRVRVQVERQAACLVASHHGFDPEEARAWSPKQLAAPPYRLESGRQMCLGSAAKKNCAFRSHFLERTVTVSG